MTTLQEPLLAPNPRRFSLYPIKHPDIWNEYKKAEQSFWQAEEVNLENDVNDWKTIDPKIRTWVGMTFAWFQVADGIVGENLINTFSQEVQIPEARCFFGFQIAMENIHAECYSMLVDTLIDSTQKESMFDALNSFSSLKAKAHWCEIYTNPETANFAERLVAWAATEMIMFSASFASIFYVKAHLKKMHGLTYSNELISRDEGLHCQFACLLYSKLVNPLSEQEVHKIISGAVSSEVDFVHEALPDGVPLMTKEDMSNYVRYVADLLCKMLNTAPIYNQALPKNLTYMETINLRGTSNFFERKVSAYTVKPLAKMDKNKFELTEEF